MAAPILTNKQVISSLYVAAFGRAPDQAGLDFWNSQVTEGQSVQSVINTIGSGFSGNVVFTETYSTLSPLEFVNALYANLLNGSGDAAGVQFWVNALTPVSAGGNGWTQSQVLNTFVTAALTYDATAASSLAYTPAVQAQALLNQQALVNKATVGAYFAGLLPEASALSPDTDTTSSDSIKADPAYIASQAILRSITSDVASVNKANAVIYAASQLTDGASAQLEFVTANAPASASSLISNPATSALETAFISAIDSAITDAADAATAYNAANDALQQAQASKLVDDAQAAVSFATDAVTAATLETKDAALALKTANAVHAASATVKGLTADQIALAATQVTEAEVAVTTANTNAQAAASALVLANTQLTVATVAAEALASYTSAENAYTATWTVADTDATNTAAALAAAETALTVAKTDAVTTVAEATIAVTAAKAAVDAATLAANTLAPQKADAVSALAAANVALAAAYKAAGSLTPFDIITAEIQVSTAGDAITQANTDALLAVNVLAAANAQLLTANAALAAVSPGGSNTFTLTTGVDAVVGGAGNDTIVANDTFLSSLGFVNNLGPLDTIDGGTGVNTLNVTSVKNITTQANVSIKNVQIANLRSNFSVSEDTSNWTGLTNLNVSEEGGRSGNSITAANTTAIVINDSELYGNNVRVNGGSSVALTSSTNFTNSSITIGDTTGPVGAVTVNATSTMTDNGASGPTQATGTSAFIYGGSTVSVNHVLTVKGGSGDALDALTGGSIIVSGSANTRSVSVTQTAAQSQETGTTGHAAIVDGAVYINDLNSANTDSTKANTITSVSLDGYGSSYISTNALATLSLANSAQAVVVTDNSTAPTATTLGLTVNNLGTLAALTDNTVKTLNLTTTGADSVLALTDNALTTLNIAGTKAVNMSSTTLSALKTVTVTAAVGLTADFSTATSLTSIDASGTSGKNTVNLAAVSATYKGGTGADNVTMSAAPSVSVDGGAGANILGLAAISALSTLTADAMAHVTNFQTLALTGTFGATDANLNIANLPTGMINVQFSAGSNDTENNIAITNGTQNTSLTFNSSLTKQVSYSQASSITNGSLTVNIGDETTTGLTNKLIADGVKTLNIVSNASKSTKTNDLSTGSFAVATTLKITGNAAVNLGSTDTLATLVDGSAMTGALYVHGVVTTGMTIKAGTGGAEIYGVADSTHGDIITIGNTAAGSNNYAEVHVLNGNNTITLGSNANNSGSFVTAGNGNNSIAIGDNTGTSSSWINVGNGNNTITIANNSASSAGAGVEAGNGNNSITIGTDAGTDSSYVAVGGGNNTITLGNNTGTSTYGNYVSISGAGTDVVNLGTGTSLVDMSTGRGSKTVAGTGLITINTSDAAHAHIIFAAAAQSAGVFTTLNTVAKGEILDFHAGELQLVQPGVLGAAQTVVQTDFASYLAQAVSGNATAHTLITWFEQGGNTYIVENNNTAVNQPFNTTDQLVKIVGLHDLSLATVDATGVITIV